jgi:hypothetical protein
MSRHGNRPASNNSAPVTADPTNLGTTAAAPIGREIDRRVDPIVAAVLACPQVAGLHSGPDGQAVTYLPGRRITASTSASTRWPSTSSPATPPSWSRSPTKSGTRSRHLRAGCGST